MDETLLEIGTDKVDTEVPSPVAGVLKEILVEEGVTVEVGTVVALIATEATVVSAPTPRPAAPEAVLASSGDGARSETEEAQAVVEPDLSGDGVRDLGLREEPTRVKVLSCRPRRGGLSIEPRPLWEMRVSETARVVVGAGEAPELLILEEHQVLVVRF